jgi:hypothetical protein
MISLQTRHPATDAERVPFFTENLPTRRIQIGEINGFGP